MSKYTEAQKLQYYKGLLKQAGITQVVRAKRLPAARKKPASRSRKPAARKSGGSKYAPLASIAGGAIGGYFGGPLGGTIGSAVGGLAADAFKAITGIGDYKVVHNSVINPADSVPMFRNGKRITLVEHREYIQDIVTSATPGAFNIDSFEINAGNAACFPWLAEVAENYEQYRIHGMVFNFKSQSADALNSTNTALGTVVMATQYNMLNPVFTNKQQMENYEFGCSSRPSADLMHPIECDPKQTAVDGLFSVRLGGIGANGDPRLYDIGRFSIATVGMQGASVNIGELWVTYQVELLKPRLGDAADLFDHWTFGAGTSTAAYFGTPTQTDNSDFNVVLGSTTITIPNSYTGNLMILYDVVGDVGAWVDPTFTGSAGASALNIMINSTANQIQSSYLAASSPRIKALAFISCVNGGVITLAAATLPTNITFGEVMIFSIPGYAD